MAGGKKARSKNTKNQASSTTDTSTASHKTPPTPTGFLALPAELRNKIYRYVLVSNEPIKTQMVSDQKRGRCHLTMLPDLAMVSKQVRRETQRIFFEENTFEIALQPLKHGTLAPLSVLHNMHRQVGLAVTTLRVCCEVMKRCDGELFLFTASFTLSKLGPELFVSDEIYDADCLERNLHLGLHPLPFLRFTNLFRVCGCRIKRLVNDHVFVGRDGVVQFLGNLRRAHLRSTSGADTSRGGDWDCLIEQGTECWDCEQKGLSCIQF